MAERTTDDPDLHQEVIDPFEKFACLPFYQEENGRFVNSVGLGRGQTVVDSACGPGNISKLIASAVGSSGRIFAVDISHKALRAAQKNLLGIETSLFFVQTAAENILDSLSGLKGKVDALVCGNAIHNFSDKIAAINGVQGLLKKDGIFAFNTTFFDGGIPKGQEDFYRSWVFKALRLASNILKNDSGLRFEKQKKVEARKHLTGDEYINLVKNLGFKIISQSDHPVDLPLEAFEVISEDDEFAQGTLGRFPLGIAKQALKAVVREVFGEKGLEISTRNWLQVVAVKTS